MSQLLRVVESIRDITYCVSVKFVDLSLFHRNYEKQENYSLDLFSLEINGNGFTKIFR